MEEEGGAERSSSPTDEDGLPEALEFLLENFSPDVVFVTKDLVLRDEGLTALPRVLQHFSKLERLDISKNYLTGLPVTTMMAVNLPCLTALDVSNNRLSSLDNVAQLGMLPHLRELNLLGNPLVSVNQRSALLAHLIFDSKRPTQAVLRAMMGYEDGSRRPFRHSSTNKVIASASPSKLLTSGLCPGKELPHVASKVLSGASGEYSLYCDMNEAPTPRGFPFPMLSVLNTHVITKEDLDLASLGLPTTKVDVLKAEGKHVRLRGKKRQMQLDKDLEEMQQARLKARVETGMRRLLRHGMLDEADPGGEEDLEEEVNRGSDVAAQVLLSQITDAVVQRIEGGGVAGAVKSHVEEEIEDEQHGPAIQTPARKHRQQTCPEAWWDADKALEVDESEFLLPTQKDVVVQSAEELDQTRQSLTLAEKLFDVRAKKGVFGDIQEHLSYATARDIICKEKRDKGASARSKNASTSPVNGGRRGGAAGKQQREIPEVSFGDLLLRDLGHQREDDHQFLVYQLPYKFKKLKVHEWMQEHHRSLAVGEEIELLFTSTNIENKMTSAEASKPARQASLGKKKGSMTQNDLKRVREMHNRHVERLRIISSGAWPKDDEGTGPAHNDSKQSANDDRIKKDAGADAAAPPASGALKESAGILSKTLDRIERAHASTMPLVYDIGSEDAGFTRIGDEMWREEAARVKHSDSFIQRPSEKLRIEVDNILKSRAENVAPYAGSRERGGTSAAFVASSRSNLREVRRELKDFADSFVQQELRFDQDRRDIGASVDRLIAKRRFGEFEARKILIAGKDFASG
mmetsp:Transcript_42208/g.103430  ORF Transcript_42208/g.103430 Transcript_42208/m.103430 type:complete len:803 (-) Transcript_42208:132-2540(-)|eukprot:CAMPEP_0206217470 /NCGR_PEP_ID=MMETSP0047_2-20121206/3292_1 /ASSEMBLY_ACC=CAM_ASM_000192 /TAXON_ID=195065 /ORGANISM="Chroomonas mesostigmatica_cf, Strain CCMP1168" /LENGTH=802 /DNA_ID=CAMNT_0053639927 /DNA_START=54 /DNA_END=2462 /DNA_ORIENTATION=+